MTRDTEIGILILLAGIGFLYWAITYKPKPDSIGYLKQRLIIGSIICFITGLALIFS
jgi:hypothetical protein